jgi:sporulation protein YlmC with PRC-barrel domain
MDIPVNAEVVCADGPCGRSTYIVIDPATWQVTHLVVKEKGFPSIERLVSLDQVAETDSHLVRLRCTREELADMDHFIDIEFLPGSVSFDPYGADEYYMWPYAIPDGVVPLEHQRIPPDELAVRRGTRVQATDGHVGVVDEFLVDPENGHITHLVLREGHLWGKKDVTIPVSQVDRIEEGTVHIKLNRHEITVLPAIPAQRRNQHLKSTLPER